MTGLQLGPGVLPGDVAASWLPSSAGGAAFFDVSRTFVSRLHDFGFNVSTCAVSSHPGTASILPDDALALGDALIYITRERNTCALGGWSAGSNGLPRIIPACP